MSLMNIISDVRPKYLEEYKTSIIEKLSRKQASEGDRRFFGQYWQPYAWAAIIGFKNNERIPLEGKTDSSFNFNVIDSQEENIAKSLLLMALANVEIGKGKDIEVGEKYDILKEPKKLITIIDEYANGGFRIISRKLANDPEFYYSHNKYITELLNG